MKKIIISIFISVFLCAHVAFWSTTQSQIGQNIWSIWNNVIPSSVINNFNSQYGWNIPQGYTVRDAYDNGLLSDGVDGPITNYANGLLSSSSEAGNASASSSNPCSVGWNLGASLDGCLRGTDLVDASGSMELETGVKFKIIGWTQSIGSLLGLLAVGAIVYGAFMMTISVGDEEKVKKGKDIVKWSLLWFLALVLTGAIIRVVIELIFSIAQ